MITQENISYTADEIKAMVKTIEELREKYNEALSRAKHALDCDRNNLVSTDVSLIYSMFPELKGDEEQIIERLKGCVYAADLTIEGRNELIAWLEKQGEQKPDDVEQKFHEGDAVVSNQDGKIYTIGTEYWISGDNICLHGVDGSHKWINKDDLDRNYRLWTIEDAKDGDVLMTTKIRNCPFIYRKTDYNNDLAYYYAGVDANGDFCEGCLKRTMYHFGSVANITPATKEQRDQLFEAMKEAGYEWDAENKVLKKIEPKKLDADEVIEWLHKHTCTACFDKPNKAISLRIDEFKKDFGL